MEYKVKCNSCQTEMVSDEPMKILVDAERVAENKKALEDNDKRAIEEKRKMEEYEKLKEDMSEAATLYGEQQSKRFFSSIADFEGHLKQENYVLWRRARRGGTFFFRDWMGDFPRPMAFSVQQSTTYWECPVCKGNIYFG